MAYLESVDNALRLILLLSHKDHVGVTEVASELDVAPSTAHRLLSTLAYRGFASQAEDKQYTLGPALATIGGDRRSSADIAAAAKPHLRRLSQKLQETTHLMVRADRQVRFLASVEATQALRVSSRAGTLMPAHLTSGGKLLLADLDPGELETMYPSTGVPELGLDALGVRRLHREIRTAGRRGYGVNNGESERGIAAIAAAIRDSGGHSIAALSASMPSVRWSAARLREILPELTSAAEQISALVDH